MIRIEWSPRLENVRVVKRPDVLTNWYRRMAEAGKSEFEKQHTAGTPGGGRKHRGSPNASSVAGAYPSVQSGRLLKSTGFRADSRHGEVGVQAKHGIYLAYGTRFMGPRKLVYDALKTAVAKDGGRTLEGYLRWIG
ncbi:MAG: hypothetical protein AB7F96_16430 [Beijerinckiaceae bacterium]